MSHETVAVPRDREAQTLDHYARLVCRLLDVPTSVVSVIEPQRQLFAGAAGLNEPWASERQTPLSHSFCRHVVAAGEPMVIADARLDARVVDNPAIVALDVIAYAGWPLRDSEGRPVGSLCAIDSQPRSWTQRDLDVLADLAIGCQVELDRARKAVSEGENLTRTIFESVDVALAFYDVDQRLVLANQLALGWAELAGCRLDRPPFAGTRVWQADNRTPVPERDQLVPRALRGEHLVSPMQWLGEPGRQVAVVGSSRPVEHADGRPWGTLVVARDVSALARALEVKEEFIATVSHELRTPLTSIRGYLEVLADELGPTTGVTDRAIGAIGRNAANLQSRIAELIDAGDRGRRLSVRATDVSGLVGTVAGTFGERAESAGIDLRAVLAAECWALVDPDRVEQALENLVSNALKFTGQGGQVVLTTQRLGGSVQVRVTDTGIGMTTDEVVQAGQTFWRSASARRGAVPGLGVGLSVVRRVAHDHAGSLDLLSSPGAGTTATLTLPAH